MENRIRELAYLKWEQAGYPPGDGANFWYEAEAEIRNQDEDSSPKRGEAQPQKIAAKSSPKMR